MRKIECELDYYDDLLVCFSPLKVLRRLTQVFDDRKWISKDRLWDRTQLLIRKCEGIENEVEKKQMLHQIVENYRVNGPSLWAESESGDEKIEVRISRYRIRFFWKSKLTESHSEQKAVHLLKSIGIGKTVSNERSEFFVLPDAKREGWWQAKEIERSEFGPLYD